MVQTTRQRLFYLLADFVSTSLAWFAFNLIRFFTLPYNYGRISFHTYMGMRDIILGQFLFPSMMVILYAISGYYNKVFFKSRLDDVLNSVAVSLVGSIIIFFTVLFNDTINDRLGNFEMVGMLWLIFSVFSIVPRLMITNQSTRQIWNRNIAFNSLIVGTSEKARQLAEDLEKKHRSMGFKVLGFVHTYGLRDNACTNLYDLCDIEAVADRLDIQSFIIMPDNDNIEQTISIINRLLPLNRSVYLTPATYHFLTSRPRVSNVAGQVLIDVSRAEIPESTVNLKRIGDIFLSSLALLVLAPFFAIIAMAIKRDSNGPVLYKQERIGYKKKPFHIYKFRSMYLDAEKDGPSLSSSGDTRITKVGKFLRKYRIDELPQFWNVLKGDMSIVGPRPERDFYLKQIISKAPYYNLVHQVRPGITSLGMVKYGYASNVEEMIERSKFDILYVDNVSFALDIKILFYTINTVLTGKGV